MLLNNPILQSKIPLMQASIQNVPPESGRLWSENPSVRPECVDWLAAEIIQCDG